MRKQYIEFECQHQKISRTDDFYVVGGSQKYLYAKFDFCEDWSGERQYAVFTGGGNTYRVEIVNGECEVPWEVLLTKRFFVGCEAGQRITSNAAEVVVHPCGAPEETDTPRKPTPTLQSQIGDLAKLATKAKDSLVAAVNEIFSNFLPLKGGKLTGPLATDEVFVGGELSEDGKTWSVDDNRKALHVSGRTNLNGGLVVCDNADFVGKVVCDNTVTIKGEAKHEAPMLTRDIRVGGGYDENGEWNRNLGGGPSRLAVSGTLELHGEVKAENSSFRTHHMRVGSAEKPAELKVYGDTRLYAQTKIDESLDVGTELTVGGRLKMKNGSTLDMKGGDIKNVQSLRMEGTLEVENDSKLRSIKPLKKVDDTGAEQEVYNIGTDESYYDKGCFKRLRLGTPVRDADGRIVGHEYTEFDHKKLSELPYSEDGLVEIPVAGAWLSNDEYVFRAPIGLEAGKAYTVTWNGVDYAVIATAETKGVTTGVALGNFTGETNEPFVIIEVDAEYVESLGAYGAAFPVASEGYVDFSIRTMGKIIHKLPGEFLPDGVPYSEGGYGEIPVTGMWTDNDGFQVTAPIGLEIGKTYTVNWDGTEYQVVGQDAAALSAGTDFEMPGVLLGSAVAFGAEDSGEPFVILEVPAEYAALMGAYGQIAPLANWDGESKVPFAIYGNREIIRKLDNKYLDLDWLPVYNETLLIPETTVEHSGELAGLGYEELPVGKRIEVAVDGKKYRVAVMRAGSGADAFDWIGNLAIVGQVYVGTEYDTGEPFCATVLTSHLNFLFADGSSHTITIYDLEPNKLPEEFLPESVVRRTELESALGSYITDVAALVGGDA